MVGVIIMLTIILISLLTLYIFSAIIVYGVALSELENEIKKSYTDQNKNYFGRGIEKESIKLSLLGPFALLCYICYRLSGGEFEGFRFRRKYVRFNRKP